jgi:hypothetical protein
MTTLAPGSDEWQALFRTFRYSAYRLESLQSYGASGEDASYAAFLDGLPYQRSAGKDRWLDTIAQAQRHRRLMQRVHVVTEPLTDYIRYELAWAYAPNVAAGEDIRIMPVTGEWPDDLPAPGGDYWLFDSSRLYRMLYDDAGRWLGAEPVRDAGVIVHACRWRDAALHQSVSWQEYVQERGLLIPADAR